MTVAAVGTREGGGAAGVVGGVRVAIHDSKNSNTASRRGGICQFTSLLLINLQNPEKSG